MKDAGSDSCKGKLHLEMLYSENRETKDLLLMVWDIGYNIMFTNEG